MINNIDDRAAEIDLQAEIERLRAVMNRHAAAWHPWYGPCDALGPNETCAECDKQRLRAPAGDVMELARATVLKELGYTSFEAMPQFASEAVRDAIDITIEIMTPRITAAEERGRQAEREKWTIRATRDAMDYARSVICDWEDEYCAASVMVETELDELRDGIADGFAFERQAGVREGIEMAARAVEPLENGLWGGQFGLGFKHAKEKVLEAIRALLPAAPKEG